MNFFLFIFFVNCADFRFLIGLKVQDNFPFPLPLQYQHLKHYSLYLSSILTQILQINTLQIVFPILFKIHSILVIPMMNSQISVHPNHNTSVYYLYCQNNSSVPKSIPNIKGSFSTQIKDKRDVSARSSFFICIQFCSYYPVLTIDWTKYWIAVVNYRLLIGRYQRI